MAVCLGLSIALAAVAFRPVPAASSEQTASVQNALSAASSPAGPLLVATAEKLAHQLGLPISNDPFTNRNIGGAAERMRSRMSDIARLITAGSYVAGFGFAIGAILKFKMHKDNPTQVPISMPICLLFVAAALIFLPSVFKSGGGSLFPLDPRTNPSPVSAMDLLDIVALAIQQADAAGATQKTSRGPLLSADVSAGIMAELAAHGLTGKMLDTYTQLGLLTADALVAGARVGGPGGGGGNGGTGGS